VNVLITGGTGFIGSRLGLRCLKGGHSVRILGQENTPAESSNRKLLEERGARIVLASVTQKELLPELLQGIDVVYHLAAAQHEVNVPDQRFRDVNVIGTANLLEAGVTAGIKRFVHGSTIGVYGAAMEGLLDEKSPLEPDNIYGKTKLEGENVVLSFNEKLPVVIIRIPETYGPGDRRLLKLFKAIRKGVFIMIGDGNHRSTSTIWSPLYFSRRNIRMRSGDIYVVAGKEPQRRTDSGGSPARLAGISRISPPPFPLLTLAAVVEKTLNRSGSNHRSTAGEWISSGRVRPQGKRKILVSGRRSFLEAPRPPRGIAA
jgi:dTDP-4-dehydrorhamnose reductase